MIPQTPQEWGSPPHAGKGLIAAVRRSGCSGLTPARGEGTKPRPTRLGLPWAHPRTRGRDWPWHCATSPPGGSPPHAGKGQAPRAAVVVGAGLTPARGEGTGNVTPRPVASRAHPRTRGRDPFFSGRHSPTPGSPPHAGKGRRASEFGAVALGLTPARGEGTPTSASHASRPRAHPRTRGRDPGCP